MRQRTGIWLLALVAALSLLAGGCGNGDEPSPLVTEAPQKMIERGPWNVRSVFTYGESEPGDGKGVIDQATRRSRVETQLPSLGPVVQLADDTIVYYRLPKEIFAVKKPWFRIDLKNPPSLGTLATMATISYNGPITMVDYLRGATATKEVGQETIDGTPTTHFKVTISLTKAVAQAPAEFRDSVRLMAEHTRDSLNGRNTLVSDVWMDPASGTVKRQKSVFAFAGQSYSFDLTYTDSAKGTTLTPPPKAQITDGSEL